MTKNNNIISEIPKEFEGYWYDEIWLRDEKGNEYLSEETPIKKNLIVADFAALISGLLAGEPSFFGGILFHAIGEGATSWDVSLPSPSYSDSNLLNEIYRKSPDTITYEDSDNNPVGSVSLARAILVKTIFPFGTDADPFNNKFIRTQGLVGGDATSVTDSGLFVDVINHKAINKTKNMKLVRYIRILLG